MPVQQKLSFPGYFWCSPFSQPHPALPASIPCATPGHMHPRSHAGNHRTPAAFWAGIPWQDPCRNQEYDRATETAFEAGLPSRQPGAKGGKLILRRDGSTFLPQHPTAAAVTPWSTLLALQTLTEQETVGVEKENSTGTTIPCLVCEEAESYMPWTGSWRLLDKYSPKT